MQPANASLASGASTHFFYERSNHHEEKLIMRVALFNFILRNCIKGRVLVNKFLEGVWPQMD
jgi:hypothetical protein